MPIFNRFYLTFHRKVIIRFLSLMVLLVVSATAEALDNSDAGYFAVVHNDGHVTDFTFFVSYSGGSWNIEKRNQDGSWTNVTCEKDCKLKDSTAEDIKRFFPPSVLEKVTPSCVHDAAFAFCSYTLKSDTKAKHYLIVALVEPPKPVYLTKLSDDRPSP